MLGHTLRQALGCVGHAMSPCAATHDLVPFVMQLLVCKKFNNYSVGVSPRVAKIGHETVHSSFASLTNTAKFHTCKQHWPVLLHIQACHRHSLPLRGLGWGGVSCDAQMEAEMQRQLPEGVWW